MNANLQLIETDRLIDELFARYDDAAFMAQRSASEDDLLERWEMKGKERVVQGLCTSMIARCEVSIRKRSGASEY